MKALRYIKPLKGWSQPHLIMCEDGELYIVKLMNNPQGVRALANEWVCSRLAKRLDLPLPRSELIYISEDIAKTEPILQNLCYEGPHYGSLFIPDCTDHPTEEQLAQCTNKEQVADIIIFDHWLTNNDRHLWRDGEQNIIVSLGESSHLWMIDNGNICSGPNWTRQSLASSMFHKELYWGDLYQKLLPFLDVDDPFGSALSKFQSLAKEDLVECVGSIPTEWEVTNRERALLILYMLRRSEMLKEIMTELEAYIQRGISSGQ